MKRYISEDIANEQYNEIFKIHSFDTDVLNKANRLRSRFDIILRLAINKKYQGGLPNDLKMAMFNDLLNDLFEDPDERAETMKRDLHKVRIIFNKKVQHLFDYEQKVKRGKATPLSYEEYRFCLKIVTEFVSFISSAPIPPPLLNACEVVKTDGMKRHLEIVILLELFDSLSRLNEGTLVFNNLRSLLQNKQKQGFDKLDIHVVVYNPPFEVFLSGKRASSHVNDALKTALTLLDASVERYHVRKDQTDKPWLIWLCFELNEKLQSSSVERLKRLTEAKDIGFYPIYMRNKQVAEVFKQYWHNCGPESLDPLKSDNFFSSSVLSTVKKMQ